jgi:hypothetical protein
MSYLEAPQSVYGMPGPAPERRTSALAVTALVSSLVFCCPCTTVMGVILGVIALAVVAAKPDRKGKGLAVAAIMIGLVLTAAWGVLFNWAYQDFSRRQMEGPRTELHSAYAGDYAGFRAGFYGPAAAASDEEIKQFAQTLEQRYGAFRTARLDETRFDPFKDMMNPVKTAPYVLEFEQATIDADIEIASQDPASGRFLGGLRFGRIVIHDDDAGDLEFPPPVNGGSPPDPDADVDVPGAGGGS